MKKRILLITFMVALLACLFVISASAAEPDTTRETFTLTDGTVLPIWDTDGNGLIWYISTNNTADGFANYDYVSNKQKDSSSYPYVEYNTWSGSVQSFGTGYQMSWLKVWDLVNGTKTEMAYSRGEKVILANLQGAMYNSTTLFNCFNTTFQNAKKLEAVYFDEGTRFLVSNALQNCYELRYTNVEDTALVLCGGEANFAECKKLASIVLPDTVQSVGRWQFQTTAITEFTIPESVISWGDTNFKQCYYLENVYGYEALIKRLINNSTSKTATISANTFVDCNVLNMPFTNGIIPEGVTAIGGYAFDDCNGDGWDTVILPNSLTNIGQNSFQNCDGIKKVVLGASFTTWDSYDGFKNCNNLEEVYMPATMKSIAGNVFNVASSDCVFYYTGTKSQLDALKTNTNSNNTAFLDAYKKATSLEEFKNIETKSGRYIVYGVNACDAFYNGIHELDPDKSNACAGICANCGELSLSANPVHIEKVVITFADLAKAGTKVTTCKNENCPYHVEETLNAVFTFNGYSSDIATRSYITAGYLIDHESLEAYKSTLADGVAFSFGFVGLATKAENTLNTTPIDSATGEVTASYMMQVDLSKEASIAACTAVDFKIAGDFTNEVYASVKIGMALYTSLRTTSGGVDTYTINYIVADGEEDSKSSTEISEVVYQTKFPTQNEEVVD